MRTSQHLGSASLAAMVAAFPRGPRIAFAPDGDGRSQEQVKAAMAKEGDKKDAAKPDAVKKDAAPKADGAKKDGDGPDGGGDKLDRLLSMMDTIGSRLDATNARMDAIEAKADASKKDEMSQPSKEEREASERQSGEESAQEKERDKAGVGDASKKDGAKKDEDAEDIERKKREGSKDDASKKDATPKADAVDTARYERDIADIRARQAAADARLPRVLTDAEEHEFATTQAKADSAYSLHGKRAPAPMNGETLMAYRLRTARELQKFSEQWKGIDLSKLAASSPDAYAIAEDRIYADSAVAANNPVDLGAGELRRVKRYDEGLMRDVIEYKGKNTYVKSLSPVAQRFEGFKVSPRAA